MVKKNSVPNGWRTVKPIGQRISGTRFIAFKVPLKGMANQRLTPTQKFTPKDLISSIKAQNEELGLIIDLSNTTRYYDTKDLPKNVEYKKLCTAGLEVPDDDTILQFKRLVSTFLFENINNEKIIGVHCTNGVSRTGYLICRYLIDVDCWDPEKAIQAFGEARGHQMEGSVYLSDLKNGPMRSNLGIYAEKASADTNDEPSRCPQDDSFYRRPEQRPPSIHGHRFNNNLKSEMSEDPEFHNMPGRRPRSFFENQCRDFRTEEEEDFFDSRSGGRNRPMRGHQSHGFQGDRQMEDYFGSSESEQRRPPFRGPQSDRPIGDKFSDRDYGQRQSFHDSPSSDFPSDRRMKDRDFPISECGQREPPIHGPPSRRRFPSNRQMENLDFPNTGPEQRQHIHNPPSRGFPPDREMEDCDYPSNESGQRRSFHGSLTRDLSDRQMGDFDFPNSGPRQRQPFHGPPSRRFSPDRQMEDSDLRSHGPDFRPDRQMKDYDFSNNGPGQRQSTCNTPSQSIPHDGEMENCDYPNSGPKQRQPFHDPLSHGFSPDRHMEDTDFRKIGPGQRQPPYDGSPSRSFPLNRRMDDREFPNRESGQRQELASRRFPNDREMKDHDFSDSHSAHDFQSDRQVEDCDFRNSGQRQPPFRGPPSRDFQPDRQVEDCDFSNNSPRQRQQFYDGPPSHSFPPDREMEDYAFHNRERGQKPPFQDTPSPGFRPNRQIEESHFPDSGPEQRKYQFRGPPSAGFQSDKPMEEFGSPNSASGQRQLYHSSPSRGFRPEVQMQDTPFPNRRPGERQLHRPPSHEFHLDREMQDSVFTHSSHEENQQPFCDTPLEQHVEDRNIAKPGLEETYFPSSYNSKANTQMEDEDFFNRPRRLQSLQGPQSHELKVENKPWSNPRKQVEEFCDFRNERTQQNSESFKTNQYKKDLSAEWQSERERPSQSGPIKRRHPSDNFNRGDKRFTPYTSRIHPSHPSMSEKHNLRDCEKRSSSSGVLMESDKSNHASFLSYDYNFGLSNQPSHKEERDYNRSTTKKSNQNINIRKA